MERNARLRARLALFEIGPVFYARQGGRAAAEEQPRLAIVLTGPRQPCPPGRGATAAHMDFFDLKGVLEALFDGLHLEGARFEPGEHPSFHPGKCAR